MEAATFARHPNCIHVFKCSLGTPQFHSLKSQFSHSFISIHAKGTATPQFLLQRRDSCNEPSNQERKKKPKRPKNTLCRQKNVALFIWRLQRRRIKSLTVKLLLAPNKSGSYPQDFNSSDEEVDELSPTRHLCSLSAADHLSHERDIN